MKETQVEKIAKDLNVSPSVVVRTLRHCSGVDSETRHRILMEAENLQEPVYRGCRIYVILPDTPRYFWEPLRLGVKDVLERDIVPFKVNVFTKPSDETAILRYLSEAEQMDAQVIIIAGYSTDQIRRRIDEIKEDRLILFLSEYTDLTNTFYCGSDTFSDGFQMGKQYAERYADYPLVTITYQDELNSFTRLTGFLEAVKTYARGSYDNRKNIDLTWKHLSNFKLAPSKIAPLLLSSMGENDRTALYVPIGIQQLTLAIAKAKLTDRTVLMCHDLNPAEDLGKTTVSCRQNVYEQGRAAALFSTRFVKGGLYPAQKETFISSLFSFQ